MIDHVTYLIKWMTYFDRPKGFGDIDKNKRWCHNSTSLDTWCK